ncbi:MAG: hypothetical protein AB7E47_10080 [Desulfovibrionaceae bacterium]
MLPAALVPAPDAIPVASVWFEVLLLVTFLAHLLLMNVIVGGAIISFARAFTPSPHTAPPTKALGKQLPTATALTVNFGVAPLLFLQVLYGQFIYSSSVVIAWWWLAVIGLVMAAYYAFYIYTLNYDRLEGYRLFVMAAAMGMLLLTGFIFVNNMTLMLRPDRWMAYFDHPGGTLLNLGEPTLIPRYLHFMLGAVAVGGLYLAFMQQRKKNKGLAGPEADTAVRSGMRWFTLATIANTLVGFWFFASLPREAMLALMGGSSVATVVLILGVVGTGAALYTGSRRMIVPAAASTLFTLITMVGLRDIVRRIYLAPYFSTADLTVTGEYGSMTMFLISLVLGLGLVFYMLTLAARTDGGTKEG